jgi:hypothetical protein
VTECNCSICRRLGARWAYYSPAQVGCRGPGSTQPYVWGDRMLAFHRCRSCGVTTHWQSLDGTQDRMGINARMIDGPGLGEDPHPPLRRREHLEVPRRGLSWRTLQTAADPGPTAQATGSPDRNIRFSFEEGLRRGRPA